MRLFASVYGTAQGQIYHHGRSLYLKTDAQDMDSLTMPDNVLFHTGL